MISPQALPLVQGLLTKTRSGEAAWIEPNDVFAAIHNGYVRLSLPRSSVIVARDREGVMLFRVLNEAGTYVLDEKASPKEPGYAELAEILTLAIRRYRQVDETLNDLTSFLESGDKRKR